MAIFVLVLAAGFAYVWIKRDLEWVKSPGSEPRSGDE
jgi:hypothetical protein